MVTRLQYTITGNDITSNLEVGQSVESGVRFLCSPVVTLMTLVGVPGRIRARCAVPSESGSWGHVHRCQVNRLIIPLN